MRRMFGRKVAFHISATIVRGGSFADMRVESRAAPIGAETDALFVLDTGEPVAPQ